MARILVVDDESDVRFLARLRLGQQGHDVLLASDGVMALELLDEEDVDLVLSDVHMPRMDGHELRAALEASRPHLRIVLWSSVGGHEDDGVELKQVMDLDVADWIAA